MFQTGAKSIQCLFEIPEDLHGLRIGIIGANNLTVRTKCCRSRYVNPIADSHGARTGPM